MTRRGYRLARLAVFGLVLAGLVGAESLVHRHPHFELAEIHGFFPLLGVGATAVLILIARLVRVLFRREEDYYDG